MKNVKKFLSAILFAFALLLIAPAVLPGYSNTATVQAAPIKITLFKGYSTYISKRTLAASNLSWSSSNTSIATVEVVSQGSGKTTLQITPKSSGTAYIRYKKPNGSSYVNQYEVNVVTVSRSSGVRSKKASYTLNLKGVTDSHSIKWSVSDSNVLSLSSATKTSVKVTAKAKGTAYVYVSIDGAQKRATRIKVEEPSLSKSSIGLTKGNTYTLKVNNTTQKVTWSSSATSIATVSAGKVTAKAKGSAYIYATVAGVRYRCKVSVSEPLTAADYMENLKATIQKSSRVNNAGNHYIYRGVKNGTSQLSYYVIYEKSQDRLRFMFRRKDSDSKRAATINMYIYNPSKSYKTTPSLTITTKKGVSFKTKRIFTDYRTYSNSTDYTYQITKSNVTLTTTYRKNMQSLSNDYLQLAMKGWDALLKRNNSSLTKIGFKAY